LIVTVAVPLEYAEARTRKVVGALDDPLNV
jgi:hypothetical protein